MSPQGMRAGDYDEEREVFAFHLPRQEYRRLAEIAAYASGHARRPAADPPRLTVEFVVRCYVREGMDRARVPVGPSGETGIPVEEDR